MARTRMKTKTEAVEKAQPAEEDVQHPNCTDEAFDVFSVPVDQDKDFISRLPSEILTEIFSYLILDHDPERAVKKHEKESKHALYKENPHVLLSLAAMSCHFRIHVDDFCLRHLTKYSETYHFWATAEMEEKRGLRRSERLKTKPDIRCYRMELVRTLGLSCFRCGDVTGRRALMYNGVGCCLRCDRTDLASTLTLTEAREQYGLQDWMLIPTRKPHLRAKQLYLPTITYGTVRTGTPYYNGMTISYRFFKKDVEAVAAAMHGDVEAHVAKKAKERLDRKIKKRDIEHRKMKIRHHENGVRSAILFGNKFSEKRHTKRLNFYKDPNCNEGYDSPSASHRYGDYADIHKRLCIRDECSYCKRQNRMKYSDMWKEMYNLGWWDSDSSAWDSDVYAD